jgi:pimeloyl-ACP methyl ester carboxylesterase
VPTFQRDGVDIHYEVEWAGPDLFLHTGGGGDLRMWRLAGYVAALTDHRLVLIDHRGHGRSGRPNRLEDHPIDTYVDDVLAIADRLGSARFSFFGYSGGADVGYRLAATHPDRVNAFIALGTPGGPEDSMADTADLATSVRAEGPTALMRGLRAAEPELPPWFGEQMFSTDPEMFALHLKAWAAWGGPWSELDRIVAPSLVVVGEREEGPDGPAGDHARALASRLRDGRAAVLPDLGHCMAFVRSDMVVPLVERFLDDAHGKERA